MPETCGKPRAFWIGEWSTPLVSRSLYLPVQHIATETVIFIEKQLDCERCLEGCIHSTPCNGWFLFHVINRLKSLTLSLMPIPCCFVFFTAFFLECYKITKKYRYLQIFPVEIRENLQLLKRNWCEVSCYLYVRSLLPLMLPLEGIRTYRLATYSQAGNKIFPAWE